MIVWKWLAFAVLIIAWGPAFSDSVFSDNLYLRYISSPSHGVPIYLSLEQEREDGSQERLGYYARNGLFTQPPPAAVWLKPGEAGDWVALPGPPPGRSQRFTLTCFCAGGEATSYTVIFDLALRPNGPPIVLNEGDAHSVILPVQGSRFRFIISADERGKLALGLGPSPIQEWLKKPDLPYDPGPPPCRMTTDLIARKRIMLGVCGYHNPDEQWRAKMRELVEFYRGLSLNFVYDLYHSGVYPWSGDWPTMCRDIRAFQAMLNEAGIAGCQSVLGRWLSEEAFRQPEARLVLETGRRDLNHLCPRKARLQQDVIAKLYRNIPFDGFHIEEPSTAMCYCDECQVAFRKYLEAERQAHPSNFFFAEPLAALRAPTKHERFTRRDVWWHWFWFTLRSYRDYYASLFEAARRASRQKWDRPCLTMTSIGYSGVVLPMMGARHTDFLAHPEVSGMLNALYWHCGEKVTVDSFKDYHLQTSWCKGQSLGKPVWFYIVGKSTKQQVQPWWFETEVYDSLLAGLDGFIIWPPPDEKSADLLPAIRRAFGFVKENMDSFAGVESCAQAAIAYNYDQTTYELFGPDYKAAKSHTYFCEHVRAIFHVLSDLHVPTDYVVPLTSDSLKRYRLLVLDELRCITDEQASAIREWVRQGGSLLAMGDTSGYDLYERPRANYPLADVFGVRAKSRKLDAASPIQLSETREVLGGMSGQTVGYGADLFMYWRFFYKHIQDKYALAPDPKAQILARWSDGSAAIVANEFGKGRCVYTGAFLQFISPEKRTELARSLIRWLLRHDLPVVCEGLPPAGDINILRKGDRLFVHLLNLQKWRLSGDPYSPTELKQWTIERAQPLNDLKVTVALPVGMTLRRAHILSPDAPGRQDIPVQVADAKAHFTVPRLDLYCVVMLEP